MRLSPEERTKRTRSVRLHVIVALFTLMVLIAVNALTRSLSEKSLAKKRRFGFLAGS